MEKQEKLYSLNQSTLQQKSNSDLLAQKITDIIDEDSLNQLIEIRKLLSCYQCAVFEVETKFRVLNEQFSLDHEHNPIDSIKTRIKSAESIHEKLLRKNLAITVQNIENELNDIAGIRVICSFVDDIYMLADCLLQQDDITLIKKKDYIKNPKENGYRSLHLVVEVPIFLQNEKKMMKVEVQLRTIAMDFWANLEHKLRYKKNLDKETASMISAELYECADTSASLDQKMQRIRNIIEN